MKQNKNHFCALCLVLGMTLASAAAYADRGSAAGSSGFLKVTESNVGPIINDYSDQGATEYDGPRPEPTTKSYRDPGNEKTEQESAQQESKPRNEPIINDYSSMGADGDSDPETAANRADTGGEAGEGDEGGEPSGPIVNDYSSEGAEYTSGGGSAEEEESGGGSGDTQAPQDLTTADLVVGHEKFNGNCAQCHGQDGVGSTFAPNLVDRLEGMDYAHFVDVVTNGKSSFDSSTGGYSVMPGWANNPGVMTYMNELWGYLKARSDGDLGTGRPK